MLCGGGVAEDFNPEETSATLFGGGGAGGSSFRSENRLLFLGGSDGRLDAGGVGADGVGADGVCSTGVDAPA